MGEIVKYNQHAFDLKGKASGKTKTTCPFCSPNRGNPKDRSVAIDIDKGVFYCHHCNKKGQLHKYGINGSINKKTRLHAYFERRGISPDTLSSMGVTMQGKWIQFPFIKNGNQVNTKSRSFDKEFRLEKGKEIIPYNIDALKNASELIITEGEIDALTFIECGYENVISVPNGANTNLEYLKAYDFSKITKFYIAVDNDKKGQQLSDILYTYFGADRCVTGDYNECKDINELYCIYGKQSVVDVIGSAQNPLYKQLDELGFNINSIFEDSTPIIFVGEHEAMTLGNFSVIHGKKKAGKGFFGTLIINAFLNITRGESMISGIRDERKKVIILDTEQSPNMAQGVLKRVARMGGNAENIIGYTLRGQTPDERLILTELAIKKHHKECALFLIDGLRDLAQKGINDEETATVLSSKLLKWTLDYNIHIIVFIHQNKGDGFARGHLGSELVNKAETVFSVSLSKYDPLTREIIAEDTRNMPLPEVYFIIEDYLPVITNRPAGNENGNRKIMPGEISTDAHQKMMEDFVENGVKPIMKGYLSECVADRLEELGHGSIGKKKADQFIRYWITRGWIINSGTDSKANYAIKRIPN